MYDYQLIFLANVISSVAIYNFAIDFVDAREARGLTAKEGLGCFPENDLVQNPFDCSSFLVCNHQRYMKVDCPKSTHFDPKRKTCNSPDRVSF